MKKIQHRKERRRKLKKTILIIKKSVEISLTDEDKIIYIYECNEKNDIVEIVNVSYLIFTKEKWITILRFDSEHGYLHGHRRISLNNEREVVFTAGVKKKGGPHRWLTWAVQYLKKNCLDYKRGFLRRSKN